MWAAANGQLDTVRQLHRAGVDLARLSRGNWNVLMLAVHSGNANVVSYLLDKGSDPNQPNHLGESAASYAENLAKSSKEAGDGDSYVHAPPPLPPCACVNPCCGRMCNF